MHRSQFSRIVLALSSIIFLAVQVPSAAAQDSSEVQPPVTKADLQIVQRARHILDSPAKWNRADTRECPETARTFSLYCALEKATNEVTGSFEHRGAVMQEARFAIDTIAPNANYEHRLMGYNNDPATSFSDIQKVFDLLESRIAARLKGIPQPPPQKPDQVPAVTETDLKILVRARELLDSPAKWNRADTQDCPSGAPTISLFCAFKQAEVEIAGSSGDHRTAIHEARVYISETAPNRNKYQARLTDFNNDPAVSFADIQTLFQQVEQRLTKRMKAAKN